MNDWNPHYLAYCRANGNTPEQQQAADAKRWPGGCMTGFLLWMSDRLTAYRKAHPGNVLHGGSIANVSLLTEWLRSQHAETP